MVDETPTNPIRELALDSATESVPPAIDDRLDFAAWMDAVDVVADDLETTLAEEVA